MAEKNKLTVDTDAVLNAVNTITAQLEVIQGVRENVSGKVMPELESVWSGPAKDAYTAELAKFLEDFSNFIKSGKELNDALSKAQKDYSAAEQEALSKTASLTI